jgi:hypothetical protein
MIRRKKLKLKVKMSLGVGLKVRVLLNKLFSLKGLGK